MSKRRMLGTAAALAGVVVIVTVVLALIGVFAASAAEDPVVVNANVSKEDNLTVVDISVKNNTKDLVSFQIIATVPGTGKLVSATPPQYVFNGQTVRWENSKGVGGGKTATGYQMKFDGAAGEISVNVKYWGTSVGNASTGPVAIGGSAAAAEKPAAQQVAATPTPEPPRRGCLACHVLADATTGKYTLGYEAAERAEHDYGADHPGVSPSGAKVDKFTVANVAACLECHKPSKDNPGVGVGAPITLRDIVHPAHMFSTAFKEHYGGNCFTCHNVRGDGTFELLSEKVDVNDKGVPKALLEGKGKIPGVIPPSEGGR